MKWYYVCLSLLVLTSIPVAIAPIPSWCAMVTPRFRATLPQCKEPPKEVCPPNEEGFDYQGKFGEAKQQIENWHKTRRSIGNGSSLYAEDDSFNVENATKQTRSCLKGSACGEGEKCCASAQQFFCRPQVYDPEMCDPACPQGQRCVKGGVNCTKCDDPADQKCKRCRREYLCVEDISAGARPNCPGAGVNFGRMEMAMCGNGSEEGKPKSNCSASQKCPDGQMCCKVGCDVSLCLEAIVHQEKAGVCPQVSDFFEMKGFACERRPFYHQCTDDADCPGERRCCQTPCGFSACVAPKPKPKCRPECKGDQECFQMSHCKPWKGPGGKLCITFNKCRPRREGICPKHPLWNEYQCKMLLKHAESLEKEWKEEIAKGKGPGAKATKGIVKRAKAAKAARAVKGRLRPGMEVRLTMGKMASAAKGKRCGFCPTVDLTNEQCALTRLCNEDDRCAHPSEKCCEVCGSKRCIHAAKTDEPKCDEPCVFGLQCDSRINCNQEKIGANPVCKPEQVCVAKAAKKGKAAKKAKAKKAKGVKCTKESWARICDSDADCPEKEKCCDGPCGIQFCSKPDEKAKVVAKAKGRCYRGKGQRPKEKEGDDKSDKKSDDDDAAGGRCAMPRRPANERLPGRRVWPRENKTEEEDDCARIRCDAVGKVCVMRERCVNCITLPCPACRKQPICVDKDESREEYASWCDRKRLAKCEANHTKVFPSELHYLSQVVNATIHTGKQTMVPLCRAVANLVTCMGGEQGLQACYSLQTFKRLQSHLKGPEMKEWMMKSRNFLLGFHELKMRCFSKDFAQYFDCLRTNQEGKDGQEQKRIFMHLAKTPQHPPERKCLLISDTLYRFADELSSCIPAERALEHVCRTYAPIIKMTTPECAFHCAPDFISIAFIPQEACPIVGNGQNPLCERMQISDRCETNDDCYQDRACCPMPCDGAGRRYCAKPRFYSPCEDKCSKEEFCMAVPCECPATEPNCHCEVQWVCKSKDEKWICPRIPSNAGMTVKCASLPSECKSDMDCVEGKKYCCKDICGRKVCKEPFLLKPKRGKCPHRGLTGPMTVHCALTSPRWRFDECKDDEECSGRRKCCRGWCGNWVCDYPTGKPRPNDGRMTDVNNKDREQIKRLTGKKFAKGSRRPYGKSRGQTNEKLQENGFSPNCNGRCKGKGHRCIAMPTICPTCETGMSCDVCHQRYACKKE